MAVSQDFEARRRERLKMQHKKRERERRIQRIVLIIAVAFLAFLLIFNIVRCSKKPNTENTTPLVTDVPSESDSEAKFDPSVPTPKEGRNSYLDIIKDSGQKNHVYLTFDNGPSEDVTPEILDVLRRYNVKATFFMNGADIKDHPYLCTRAIEEGHLVLPLSKSGNADILYADKTTFMDEVEETYDLIVENTPDGKKPIKLYRFLGGSSNGSYKDKQERYKDELAKNGYYYCDWNASVGDSSTSRTAEQLLTYFNTNKPKLNNLVIQLNNKKENIATPKMLGDLIESLLDEGYTFNRLDEIEFINEINYDDEDEEADTKNNSDDDDDDGEKVTTTKKPEVSKTPTATKSPSSTTSKATQKPTSTKAPSASTQKPATHISTVTQPPKTATLPPSSGNEIDSE